jgi:hypothetical protein
LIEKIDVSNRVNYFSADMMPHDVPWPQSISALSDVVAASEVIVRENRFIDRIFLLIPI